MRINKKLLIYIVLIIPFIKPQIINFIDTLNKINYVLKAIAAIYILKLYISKILIAQKKCSKFLICIIIYNLLLIISTIINKGNIVQCIGVSFGNIIIVMLTEVMIFDDIKIMFKTYIFVLDLYFGINTIGLILFPGGLYNGINFLGIDNRFIFYYLPLLCFRFCYSYMEFNKIRIIDYIIYIICLCTLIYTWSVSAMIGLMLYMILFVSIGRIKGIEKIFNLTTYSVSMLITNYLIVIQKIQYNFKGFLENILHKDATFTQRTLIWEKVLTCIKKNIIIGNGYEYENVTIQKINGANHAHNNILMILYRGGILLFLTYIAMIGLVIKKMKKYRDKKIAKVISFTILISFIMTIFDTFDFALYFVIFQLGYYIEKIVVASKSKLLKEGEK